MICPNPNCKSDNRPELVFCSTCGNALYPTMRVQKLADSKYAEGKNPFIATIVSFIFPAGGQLYNGDFKKAGILWVAYLICAFFFFTGVATIPAVLVSLPIWAFAIFDAYRVAKREKAIW